MSLGVLSPEMITLRIWISDLRLAHPQYFFQHSAVIESGPTQFGPVPLLAARDHIVNGGQGELLMGEMPM